MTPGRTLRLETLAGFGDDAWDELAEASGNVFATREWNETWWRHFGGGRPLHLTGCVDEDGRLVGILPLYLWKSRPLRVLRFLGHGPGDQLGPICAAENRQDVGAAFATALGEGRWSWHLLLAEQLLGSEGWPALLRARLVRTTGSPVLRWGAAGTWDEFLAGRSPNFRQQARRRARKLERDHAPSYRLATGSSLETDLETLFELHDRRWAGGESAFTGARVPFHREFARLALERGWLRLWLLEVEGAPVAAWYGFRYGGADSYYQAGRDPAWDEYSAGYLLLLHSIRDAVESGATEYRFLRGDEPYKYRFTSIDPQLEILARGRGPLGSLAVRAGVRAYRSPVLRRLMRGPLDA